MQEATGVASGNDPCDQGTPLQSGEVRPILLRFEGQPSATPKTATVGTVVYQCVDDMLERAPVSLDGVPITNTKRR